jgi:hypothetical protein
MFNFSGSLINGMRQSKLIKTIWGKKTLFLISVLFPLIIFSLPTVKASTQISIVASEDSYVDNSSPNTTFGDSIFLYTHNYSESVAQASAGGSTQNYVGPITNTWLKFDLSQVPSTASIDSFFLKMRTSMWGTRSVNNVRVYICDDNSWTESGITWNNAPSPSSIPLDAVDCVDPDVDYYFNTNVITGKSTLTLVLETAEYAKEPAVFNSRDLGNPPTLIVSYTTPFEVGLILPIGIGLTAIILVALGVFAFKKRQK